MVSELVQLVRGIKPECHSVAKKNKRKETKKPNNILDTVKS